MDPNEKQPTRWSTQLIPARLSRDSMILVAALAFLALAILLAVVFPPGNSGEPTTGSTSVAQIGTPGASPTGRATVGPVATPTFINAPQDGTAGVPTPPLGSYPAPQTPIPSGDDFEDGVVQGTATGQPPFVPPSDGGFVNQPTQPAGSLPTFAPVRPTTGFPNPVVPTSGGSVSQPPSYPPPGGAPATPTEEFFDDDPDQGGQEPQPSTPAPAPTTPSLPKQRPPSGQQPTQAPQFPLPQPTSSGPTSDRPPSPPPQTGQPPAPPVPPAEVLRGEVRWTAAQSPIIINRDLQLAAGSSLVIEAGVEVRLAPGVSFFVDGTLYAIGQADRPIRFVGTQGQRWEGLFGRPGSNIALEHTAVRGGGAGGTVISSEGGNLVLHHAQINDNGGHIQVTGSRLEMRDSEVAGNDMPYGAAVEATYSAGGSVTLINNRIGGNRLFNGAAPVQINSQSPFDIVRFDIQRNLLIGHEGPNLVFSTNGPLQGDVSCNALMNGANGLSIRSETPQITNFALSVHDNAIEDHTPPIIPIYLEYGIGRGATSEIALDMRNNWWGSPLGPYEPERHADGRGDAVGDNIEFAPWLTTRPECAPTP